MLSLYDDSNPLDANLHMQHVRLLQAMEAGTLPQTLAEVPGVSASDYDYLVRPSPTDYRTRFIAIDGGDLVAIIIQGLSTTRPGLGLVTEAARYSDNVQLAGFTYAIQQGALEIFALVSPWLNHRNTRVRIIGHSYGGALGGAVGVLLNGLLPPDYVRVWSYGAPRPGNRHCFAALGAARYSRVIVAEDSVPHYPPHLTESPSITALAGSLNAVAMQGMGQPYGAYEVSPTGDITPSPIRPYRYNSLLLTALNYMGSPDGFFGPVHSLNFLAGRLSLSISRPVPAPSRGHTLGDPDDTPTPPGIVSQMSTGVIHDLGAASSQVPGPTYNAAVESLQLASPSRYRCSRIYGVWCVTRDGAVVAVCSGKRECHRRRNRLNSLLRW
jgi:hypothetical protein